MNILNILDKIVERFLLELTQSDIENAIARYAISTGYYKGKYNDKQS